MRPDIALPDPEAAWFVRPSGYDASMTIHGVGHAKRVLIHACELAGTLGVVGWELDAIRHAALWHDIGRTNDGPDYYHGAKSAGKVVALSLHEGLEPEIYETALYAITHHCGSEEHGRRAADHVIYYRDAGGGRYERRRIAPASALRVFMMLKDADALDRVRIGGPNPDMLRFPESRDRIARAWELLDLVP